MPIVSQNKPKLCQSYWLFSLIFHENGCKTGHNSGSFWVRRVILVPKWSVTICLSFTMSIKYHFRKRARIFGHFVWPSWIVHKKRWKRGQILNYVNFLLTHVLIHYTTCFKPRLREISLIFENQPCIAHSY